MTVTGNPGFDEARRLLHRHRIEKLLVVDEAYRCVGLITVKDMDKAEGASAGQQGRVRAPSGGGRHRRRRRWARPRGRFNRGRRGRAGDRHGAWPFRRRADADRSRKAAFQRGAGGGGQRGNAGGGARPDRCGAPMRSRSGSGRAASAPRAWWPASACRNSPRCWKPRPRATNMMCRQSPTAAFAPAATS